ncbi:MAG: hypothetical protein QOK39_2673 [Acidimicrobiaceae bacterium]|nr:hypothetical protein [Acidimicrobiaceae bacterium]
MTARKGGHFDRDVWEGRKATVHPDLGVRRLESLLLATVGTTIATDPTKLRGPDDEVAQDTGAFRGIILELVAGVSDPGTGEVLSEGGYRIYEPLRPLDRAFRFITDRQTDLASAELTRDYDIARAIRRFAEAVGKGTSSLITGYEARLLGDAFHLSALQLGGNRHV